MCFAALLNSLLVSHACEAHRVATYSAYHGNMLENANNKVTQQINSILRTAAEIRRLHALIVQHGERYFRTATDSTKAKRCTWMQKMPARDHRVEKERDGKAIFRNFVSFRNFAVPNSCQFMCLLPCYFVWQDSLASWYQRRDEYVLASWLDSDCMELWYVAQSILCFASTEVLLEFFRILCGAKEENQRRQSFKL